MIPFRNERLYLFPRTSVGIKYSLRNTFWAFMKIKPVWSIYKWWFNNIRPMVVQLTRKDNNKSLVSRIFNHISRKLNIKTENL
jgi:hypothetical protein